MGTVGVTGAVSVMEAVGGTGTLGGIGAVGGTGAVVGMGDVGRRETFGAPSSGRWELRGKDGIGKAT